ncbi:MAG TPA: AAA family ATPase [Stellaceae bacterium]|nr:AAA family ATPase [Stellaceae bacterium]
MSYTLTEIAAAGYRSLRAIRFPLRRLSVFVGANGAGKTNLYRALQLIQAAAAGHLSRALAAEGGMDSALWAGKRQARKPPRIKLMAALGDADGSDAPALAYSYAIEIGLRACTEAAFAVEPLIKEETLLLHRGPRQTSLLERRGPAVFARDIEGRRAALDHELLASQTALAAIEDPPRFPDLYMLRRTMLDWRFYHDFRTDPAAPLRRPCLAVATPTLSSDAADLAAVLATLVFIRQDTHDLDQAVTDAFPGARLVVPGPGRTASFGMVFAEHPQRTFEADELSDGTLRYLGLMGALLAYRLPAFIALNEPEASLHPGLLPPLARLIAKAAERTQIWVVTHSEPLAAALEEHAGVKPMTVIKRAGETWIEGLRLGGDFRDEEE